VITTYRIKRAFAAAGFEVRIVHPYATKQYRQPANPGNKTDDTDLAANHRAAVNGFGLVESPLGVEDRQRQLLVRHRRDLVDKRSALCCQIREHLHAAMPGYAELVDDIWESPPDGDRPTYWIAPRSAVDGRRSLEATVASPTHLFSSPRHGTHRRVVGGGRGG
jgi:hypothetical protein